MPEHDREPSIRALLRLSLRALGGVLLASSLLVAHPALAVTRAPSYLVPADPAAPPVAAPTADVHDHAMHGGAAHQALAAPVAPPVPASGPRAGIDISWPQCDHTLPALPVDFAVIGLTDGQANSVSPCFAQQVRWAEANSAKVNLYAVPNAPNAATLAAGEKLSPCPKGDALCRVHAAGRVQARHALDAAAAAKVDVPGWWLDVEDVPGNPLWGGSSVESNVALLRGWVDELRAAKRVVGVYSTSGFWRQITGGWQSGLPQWVAVGLEGVDSARRACAEPFSSGPVLMTQWLTGPYDGNVLCPGNDALAHTFFGGWARPKSAGVPPLLVIPVPHPEMSPKPEETATPSASASPKPSKAAPPPPPAPKSAPARPAPAAPAPVAPKPAPKPAAPKPAAPQPTATKSPVPTATPSPTAVSTD